MNKELKIAKSSKVTKESIEFDKRMKKGIEDFNKTYADKDKREFLCYVIEDGVWKRMEETRKFDEYMREAVDKYIVGIDPYEGDSKSLGIQNGKIFPSEEDTYLK